MFSTPIKDYDKTVGILSSGWVLTEAERVSVYIKDFAGILSEMAKKSTEVQKVNAAATKAAEHRSDFLTNVSHEMRTPLNAILGMTEMSARYAPPDAICSR